MVEEVASVVATPVPELMGHQALEALEEEVVAVAEIKLQRAALGAEEVDLLRVQELTQVGLAAVRETLVTGMNQTTKSLEDSVAETLFQMMNSPIREKSTVEEARD